MKHLALILLAFCIFTIKNNAQEASVEKNVWGIQAGIYPLSVYNEAKLTNTIALRSEVFLGFGWSGYSGNSTWEILPYISAEPRWYYNIQRRVNKNKQINNNSGNYLSVLMGLQPGFGITSHETTLYPVLYFVPTYGLRRNIGKRFNFEAAFGVGYGWEFKNYTSNGTTYNDTESGTVTNIRLAIGYMF